MLESTSIFTQAPNYNAYAYTYTHNDGNGPASCNSSINCNNNEEKNMVGAKKAKKPTRPNIFLFSVVIRHYFQDNMMNKENM